MNGGIVFLDTSYEKSSLYQKNRGDNIFSGFLNN